MPQPLADEAMPMNLGFDMLKQVRFGEATIPLKPDAQGKRIAHRAATQSDVNAEQPVS